MGEETGIFSRISDETIEAARGQTYTKSRLMTDPMAGLEMARGLAGETGGEEWKVWYRFGQSGHRKRKT